MRGFGFSSFVRVLIHRYECESVVVDNDPMSVIELSDELLGPFVAGGYSLVELTFGDDPSDDAVRTAQAFARQYAGRVKVARVRALRDPQVAARYHVTRGTQLLLFLDGVVIDRIVDGWLGALDDVHVRLGGQP